MSGLLLAEFPGAAALVDAARNARDAGWHARDAFAPFAVTGLAEAIGVARTHIRLAMFIGGVGIAALAYGTEWYSAVIDYPINSGGRPFHSWPAFMMFPFAIGIFGAAVAGLIALCVEGGLPRLHHQLFPVPGFERVSQDAFMLALDCPDDAGEARRARAWLSDAGAITIWEITP
jgi:hypothetical protein